MVEYKGAISRGMGGCAIQACVAPGEVVIGLVRAEEAEEGEEVEEEACEKSLPCCCPWGSTG